MLQLASRSNIALNKETLQLLDPLDGFERYALLKHQEFIIYKRTVIREAGCDPIQKCQLQVVKVAIFHAKQHSALIQSL